MTSSIDSNMRGGLGGKSRDANTGVWPRQSKPLRSRAVCTLAAFVQVFPAWPLVVAANRDELLARPATAPLPLRAEPRRAVGGHDLPAGGTWLGVTETGLVAGILNRRTSTPPDPSCRSRGL